MYETDTSVRLFDHMIYPSDGILALNSVSNRIVERLDMNIAILKADCQLPQ